MPTLITVMAGRKEATLEREVVVMGKVVVIEGKVVVIQGRVVVMGKAAIKERKDEHLLVETL
jgi:hypothetical protein